jgi:hypothetical protein
MSTSATTFVPVRSSHGTAGKSHWTQASIPTHCNSGPRGWLDLRIEADDPCKVEDPLTGHWSFGEGRRVCTVYHIGDSNTNVFPLSLFDHDTFGCRTSRPVSLLHCSICSLRRRDVVMVDFE